MFKASLKDQLKPPIPIDRATKGAAPVSLVALVEAREDRPLNRLVARRASRLQGGVHLVGRLDCGDIRWAHEADFDGSFVVIYM